MKCPKDNPPKRNRKMMLAIAFILIIFLAAAALALELRVTRLTERLRNVERALSLLNKKSNE
jgi:HAMP domain-containing protein